MMKLYGSIKRKITKDKNSESVPNLKITEAVLVHCNIINNDYQQDSRVLFTFVPNKSFRQLLDISPKNLYFSKLLIQNFYKLWFTDQNCKPLDVEDEINITLVIN